MIEQQPQHKDIPKQTLEQNCVEWQSRFQLYHALYFKCKTIMVIIVISVSSNIVIYIVGKQGCKNELNFLTPDKAILNLPNTFLQ